MGGGFRLNTLYIKIYIWKLMIELRKYLRSLLS
jgi:hypothetical protein